MKNLSVVFLCLACLNSSAIAATHSTPNVREFKKTLRSVPAHKRFELLQKFRKQLDPHSPADQELDSYLEKIESPKDATHCTRMMEAISFAADPMSEPVSFEQTLDTFKGAPSEALQILKLLCEGLLSKGGA